MGTTAIMGKSIFLAFYCASTAFRLSRPPACLQALCCFVRWRLENIPLDLMLVILCSETVLIEI